MTATVISFPTLFERDQIEFDRKGASNYTRAFDEAAALWDAVKVAGNGAALAGRICAFARAVEHLGSYRPESLREMVCLNDGGQIELQSMPVLLAAMV